MVVDVPRSSILPDVYSDAGHEDSDEAAEMFRRVRAPLL
jgi:hypothetical protein